MNSPAFCFLVAVSLTALPARADGGFVGHVFAVAGQVRIQRSCEFDLEPETSIRIELFYRSPNEAALKSPLEISVHAGGFQFLSESPHALETRLAFSESVVSTRYANLFVKQQDGGPGVVLLRGEISVETNAAIIRRRAPAWIGALSSYRWQRNPCTEKS